MVNGATSKQRTRAPIFILARVCVYLQCCAHYFLLGIYLYPNIKSLLYMALNCGLLDRIDIGKRCQFLKTE